MPRDAGKLGIDHLPGQLSDITGLTLVLYDASRTGLQFAEGSFGTQLSSCTSISWLQNMQNAGQEHFITVNYMHYINWARMPLVCTNQVHEIP
jgi:hypothetical protein